VTEDEFIKETLEAMAKGSKSRPYAEWRKEACEKMKALGIEPPPPLSITGKE
jgi:hypothetical protein